MQRDFCLFIQDAAPENDGKRSEGDRDACVVEESCVNE